MNDNSDEPVDFDLYGVYIENAPKAVNETAKAAGPIGTEFWGDGIILD